VNWTEGGQEHEGHLVEWNGDGSVVVEGFRNRRRIIALSDLSCSPPSADGVYAVKTTFPYCGEVAKFMLQKQRNNKPHRMLFGDKKGSGANLILDNMSERERQTLRRARRP
jgi:hypothetical protein